LSENVINDPVTASRLLLAAFFIPNMKRVKEMACGKE